MKSIVIGMCVACLVAGGLWAQNSVKAKKLPVEAPTWSVAVEKGAKWLASVQGADGGWGQDGGETSYIRQSEHLESTGNDVANTAVAALALLEAGRDYRPNVERAVDFILRKVESSPKDGLAVTDQKGTQIQRKLGPYIDTFLTSMLLARVDGTMPRADQNARVRHALEKCVAKIERNQKSDGSWNVAGGWAPVLGTSMASRSLFEAHLKGVPVDSAVSDKAERYAANAVTVTAAGAGIASADSAGVPLYQSAQALEQLSRTEADRKKNAKQIAGIQGQISNQQFVAGFGSIGGEEFFSYLNISDSLKRTGGEEWKKWSSDTSKKILNLQNSDGTWSGHHCITGRVAVTSAAILNLIANREQSRGNQP
jgi:Squalene-hopene cyclase C-terminal domain/Prenyltransferase and squalene oxidase repeat